MLVILMISISDANCLFLLLSTPGIAAACGLRLPWGFSYLRSPTYSLTGIGFCNTLRLRVEYISLIYSPIPTDAARSVPTTR